VSARRSGAAVAMPVAAALLLVARSAAAVDVGTVQGEPVQLDVTETTIVAQHFDARTPPNDTVPPLENFEDAGWGNWLNRVDTALRWGHLTAGLRLDSAVYWSRPADGAIPSAYAASNVQNDNESRFKSSVYPAKLWVTYSSPGVEVTAGDAYAQFGRGLTLSMRKIDELGIDTTVRGIKAQVTRDPYAFTFVAGFANPSRVDEATGRALWVTSDLSNGDVPTAQFGSDRVVGVDFQAGRGLPVTLSTHVTQFTRCAPYAYDASGNIETDFAKDPATVTFGTCNAADVDQWIQSLNPVPRGLQANEITMAGESVEIPTLWGHGKLYVEGVVQQRQSHAPGETLHPNGNALYAALTVDVGPTSTTVELKSNRNFYTVAGSVGKQAPELSLVAYTFLPPAESFNMIDAEGTGDFNACVEGVRVREDVSVGKNLLIYGQGVGAYSLTEQASGQCDELGHTLAPVGAAPASVQDTVWDGVTGFEYTFDHDLSHAFVSFGARDDMHGDGVVGYKEQHAEYSVAKYLGGPWSLEVQGRYRHRVEFDFNPDVAANVPAAWWSEGENYVALRVVPKWVFSQGFEFTTLIGQPLLYFNGAVTYKLTSSSNVRLFVGEQRGAFRCASGVCRYFPPFEGARAELTLRF
jgi:hypothetical protein